jgi:hypothetical protein
MNNVQLRSLEDTVYLSCLSGLLILVVALLVLAFCRRSPTANRRHDVNPTRPPEDRIQELENEIREFKSDKVRSCLHFSSLISHLVLCSKAKLERLENENQVLKSDKVRSCPPLFLILSSLLRRDWRQLIRDTSWDNSSPTTSPSLLLDD